MFEEDLFRAVGHSQQGVKIRSSQQDSLHLGSCSRTPECHTTLIFHATLQDDEFELLHSVIGLPLGHMANKHLQTQQHMLNICAVQMAHYRRYEMKQSQFNLSSLA